MTLSHEDILQPCVNTGGNAALSLATSPFIPRDSWTLAGPDCPSACGRLKAWARDPVELWVTLLSEGSCSDHSSFLDRRWVS